MQLSVILPCYNGAETIALQLEALAQQQWSGSWEVIVVNNGSTDDSMNIVEQYRDRLPHLRILEAYTDRTKPRLGVVHSYNLAIQSTQSDAVAFCEADDEIAPGWVAAMGEDWQSMTSLAADSTTENSIPTGFMWRTTKSMSRKIVWCHWTGFITPSVLDAIWECGDRSMKQWANWMSPSPIALIMSIA
jgi:glycosyltransferase involved in cell wall biosynthesis